jgi:hypothetical protein
MQPQHFPVSSRRGVEGKTSADVIDVKPHDGASIPDVATRRFFDSGLR